MYVVRCTVYRVDTVHTVYTRHCFDLSFIYSTIKLCYIQYIHVYYKRTNSRVSNVYIEFKGGLQKYGKHCKVYAYSGMPFD